MRNHIIILDRDGVINFDSPDFIRTVEEWKPIPGSIDAIRILTDHGFKVVIATNQSGVGRGLYSIEALKKIHQTLLQTVQKEGGNIQGIYYCPHVPEDNCDCRKPKTGLMKQIAKDFKIDPKKDQIYAVGDSLRDLQAAFDFGFIPILVLTGNGLKTKTVLPLELQGVLEFKDLKAFVNYLISK